MNADPPATSRPARPSARWKWLLAGVVALVAAALVLFEPQRAGSAAEAPAQGRAPVPLPRFEAALLGGGVGGSDAIGHRRALLWAFTTRDPHVDAHAGIVGRLASEAAKANIYVLGIARDQDPARVKPFVERRKLAFPILLDSDGEVARRLRLPPGDSAILIANAEAQLVGGVLGLPGEGPRLEQTYETELRRLLSLERLDEPGKIALGLRPAAPAFRVQTLAGAALDSQSLRGKVVLLVFFLPTCPHCHEALKHLQKLAGELGRDDLAIVATSIRNQRYVIESMQKEQGIKLPLYVDPEGVAQRAYAQSGAVPEIVAIDREGKLVARHRGWDKRIESLVTMETRQALGVENPLLLSKTGFSGEESCRVCHQNQHETWSLTTHAYAFETLVRHGQDRNKECVGCHVVGWEQPGGWSLESPVAHLQGVQCESCHGRGGPHQSPEFLAKGGYEAVCVTCHNPKHSLNFVFAERLPLVSHAANAGLAGLSLEERQKLLGERDVRERTLFQPGAYVGSESCRSCHEQQYALWAQSGHARAFDTLPAADRTKAECVSCHVTGHEKEGGYPAGGAPTAGVGCESCHGPGARHVAEGATHKGDILALSDKCDSCVILQICGSCHTEKWSPNFEFELEAHLDKLRHGMRPVATGATK
jgi:peroxiredoxin